MQPVKCPFYRCYLSVLLLLACHIATAQDFSVAQIPDPMRQGNHVSNPDQLISPAAEQAINILLDSLDRSGRAQVAVVLLKTIGNHVPKDVAHEIFSTWKPGDHEKNNGLLVLLVNDQRRIEFETGYGLEGDLPDVVCFRIQQHIMLPYFKQQDYDNGMIHGLQAVISVLYGQDVQTIPAPEDNTATGFMQSESSTRETPGDSSVILYFGFLIVGGISFLVMFYRDKMKSKTQSASPSTRPFLYRPGWIAFVWLFAMPWVLIFYLVNFTLLPVGVFTVAVILYAHCIIFWCYYITIVSREASRKASDMDRYNSFLTWKQAKPYLLLSILFPLPLLPFYFRVRTRLNRLRFDPYYCQTCNDIMQRIDEKTDDAFLQKYQVVEESIGSIDYDVWRCSGCNTVLIYGYDNDYSNAEACPGCTHKTLQATRKEIIQAATTSNSGWGYQYYLCGYCDFKKKETYSIPATGSSSGSSGSSDSSGSSSSGGSWGGGSSGGGGAGSSW